MEHCEKYFPLIKRSSEQLARQSLLCVLFNQLPLYRRAAYLTVHSSRPRRSKETYVQLLVLPGSLYKAERVTKR